MSNRRLVPMPARKASAPPASGNASAAAPAALAVLRTWHCFAFLIATAILLYYAKWPILFIAGAVGLFRGLDWLCHRFQRTMRVILVIYWRLIVTNECASVCGMIWLAGTILLPAKRGRAEQRLSSVDQSTRRRCEVFQRDYPGR